MAALAAGKGWARPRAAPRHERHKLSPDHRGQGAAAARMNAGARARQGRDVAADAAAAAVVAEAAAGSRPPRPTAPRGLRGGCRTALKDAAATNARQ